MNKRITRDEAIANARRDFKQFIIWLNVTHIRYTKQLTENNVFKIQKLRETIYFLSKWKSRDSEYKKLHAREYSEHSKIENYGFGVPDGLKDKVLGTWQDDEGTKHRIKMTDIGIDNNADVFYIDELRIHHVVAGSKRDFKTKKLKYMMDENVREDYLYNPEYAMHETYPDMSSRLHRILRKWIAENKKKKPDDKKRQKEVATIKEPIQEHKQKTTRKEQPTMTVQQTQQPTTSNEPITRNELARCYVMGVVEEPYFKMFAKDIFGMDDELISGLLKSLNDENNDAVQKVKAENKKTPLNKTRKDFYTRLYKVNLKDMPNCSDETKRTIKNAYDRENRSWN